MTESGIAKTCNSPASTRAMNNGSNFKSTSYIDIHQRSSCASAGGVRCASSMAGRRVAFEPINKATRDTCLSQPDELRTDSPLVSSIARKLNKTGELIAWWLAQVNLRNPWPLLGRLEHNRFLIPSVLPVCHVERNVCCRTSSSS